MIKDEDIPNLDPAWNYRVVRKKHKSKEIDWDWYGIHEVYYKDGEPEMCTEGMMSPHGDTLEELQEDLQWMLRALDAPVLNYEDIGGNDD